MEISAKFLPGSCFFSGDTVRCLVEFRLNGSGGGVAPGQANGAVSASGLVLAWASAQIQCECVTVDPSEDGGRAGGRRLPPSTPSHTSFRPVDWLEGSQIMSSSPRVLFCEARLCPGERKVVEYAEALPPDLPPSHRGRKIKINYHLLVATQALGAAVSVLKLPFRVLNTPSPASALAPSSAVQLSPHANGNALQVAAAAAAAAAEPVAVATSPFLQKSWSSLDNSSSSPGPNVAANPLEGLLQIPRRAVSYDISTASSGCLAKLSLPRSQFRLGEEVVAALRFPANAAAKCVQYSVALVYTETVSSPGADGGADVERSGQTKVVKHQDFTFGAEESSFSLEVPHAVTPGFRTASCRLEWHLHFEFVIENQRSSAMASAADNVDDEMAEWNAPRRLHVQTLEWDLPVTVLPSDPALLGHLLLAQSWSSWSRRAVALDSSAASMTSS